MYWKAWCKIPNISSSFCGFKAAFKPLANLFLEFRTSKRPSIILMNWTAHRSFKLIQGECVPAKLKGISNAGARCLCCKVDFHLLALLTEMSGLKLVCKIEAFSLLNLV
ncbi:hypothetical protein PoB_001361800 [Plakobranchus ocellatus]|uniref:Uncharacterized protein n=1 Tax=Plakobranchus ocellatus TaxID=259542 RepID=A0AAV3YXZ9_9GAST|nr:hypothetical protein PoB_001361800 [Plakobranchus ocellatus]